MDADPLPPAAIPGAAAAAAADDGAGALASGVSAAQPPPAAPPLSALEARALGCLIEKELATPDVYPLSLNALVNACNQRNNRAPVIEASPGEVGLALDGLRQKQLAALFAGADARVPKYKQTLDLVWPVEPVARVLLAELLLRGPQTTAELRAHAGRMSPLPDADGVEQILAGLAARAPEPLARKLARQTGQKEARWAQLLTGEPSAADTGGAAPAPVTVTMTLPPEVAQRLGALEAEVARLRGELASLREALGGS
ncbi:MAG: YceH family protein [Opitutaceae bacterium]|jgi:uncharacterized protein YceH (UPF0502 family)|nr:YceH family protein [Opitutaceae bacterium]